MSAGATPPGKDAGAPAEPAPLEAAPPTDLGPVPDSHEPIFVHAPGAIEKPVTPRPGGARTDAERLRLSELRSAWPILSKGEKLEGFKLLARGDEEKFFFRLTAHEKADLILALPADHRRSWMRLLAPDDAADVVQAAPDPKHAALMAMLDDQTRMEVGVLLAYSEDDAGGRMSPRYARARPEMTIDEAIRYLRHQTREQVETITYVYVMDGEQKLLGVVSFRDLFAASAGKRVSDIMKTELVTALEGSDQESLSHLFAQHKLMAIPIVDGAGRMQGIVTVDDIVHVVQEEATEDIQKIGGTAALDAPYLRVGLLEMVKKRAGWLMVLFLGEMLTATAMGYFEGEIARAVVLALFIPLIISSGGNSGSQATTLVIRAMALGEVRLRDWWKVVRRELGAGLLLGLILGTIGLFRIIAWQVVSPTYGPHYVGIAFTVAFALLGVVMFGTLAGSMLPFILRRLGLDPASASAPFVATLVDVTGLVIYFTVAKVLLGGTLL